MKIIVAITVVLLGVLTGPVQAEQKHGRGIASGGGFTDFGGTKMTGGELPPTIELDAPDVSIDMKLDGPTNLSGPAKKPENKSSLMGKIGQKVVDTIKKGVDLTKGLGRDAGYRTGGEGDNKDEDVNLVVAGSSQMGTVLGCQQDAQSGTWTITGPTGARVEGSIQANAANTAKLVNQTEHPTKARSLYKAFGGALGKVFAVGWNLSLAEAGVNAANYIYYYASSDNTFNDLRSQNFDAQVGALLLKPMDGEPGRCELVGGGGGGGQAPDANVAASQAKAPPASS